MATISNLAISISEMDEETLFNFIRSLRNNRRKSMLVNPVRKTSTTPKTPAATLNIESILSNMSETDKENLLQILEGKTNG
jgi:hypothetical protein